MPTSGDLFEELVSIMERLRAPGGCPWDREQSHASIKPYVIEEAYEVAEAIEDGDLDELSKELGDLLLQVVFHSEMAREAGTFTIDTVVRGISEKMRRRHPHVFADTKVADSDEVLRNWEKIKVEERGGPEKASALTGVPRALPALLRAHRLGGKAAHVGFDWSSAAGVMDKVREELGELEQAIDVGDTEHTAAELGDLLQALASLGRHLDIHAEDALQAANNRFQRRFEGVERHYRDVGQPMEDASPAQLEEVWQRVKKTERRF